MSEQRTGDAPHAPHETLEQAAHRLAIIAADLRRRFKDNECVMPIAAPNSIEAIRLILDRLERACSGEARPAPAVENSVSPLTGVRRESPIPKWLAYLQPTLDAVEALPPAERRRKLLLLCKLWETARVQVRCEDAKLKWVVDELETSESSGTTEGEKR